MPGLPSHFRSELWYSCVDIVEKVAHAEEVRHTEVVPRFGCFASLEMMQLHIAVLNEG